MTWKVVQRDAWKVFVNLRIKQLSSCIKSQRHAWMTIISKKKKIDLLENYLMFAHLTRIGRPDILWSVNKLARAVTKWTKACDKRLARLISYTDHTS